MQNSSVRNALMGFVAAAIAVVIAHQGMVYLLASQGILPPTSVAWSTKPIGPWNVPTIVNSIFWGGLWGALFGLIHDKLPGGALWLKGLLYGLAIVVVSSWFLVPLIKGQIFSVPNQVFFAGGVPLRLLAGALILGSFGLVTGIIYGLLNGRRA